MSGIGPVHLTVDPEQLDDLSREIHSLIQMLSAVECRPAVTAWSMGSDDVSDAVDRFVGRWEHGRQDIVEQLHECLRYVAQAVDAYRENENSLECGGSSTLVPFPKAGPYAPSQPVPLGPGFNGTLQGVPVGDMAAPQERTRP